MKTSVIYDDAHGICIVRVIGTITDSDDVRILFSPAKPILEEHGSTKVLFDIHEAKIVSTTLETFYTAAEPETWGWKRNYKAAVVYSEITEDAKFLETVGVNRGILMKIFDNIDEAKSWLSDS